MHYARVCTTLAFLSYSLFKTKPNLLTRFVAVLCDDLQRRSKSFMESGVEKKSDGHSKCQLIGK